ncbi:MAG: DUF2336 domain-containing protein [Pseudomonadota bacterium]
MMSEEWPLAAEAADDNAPARAAGGDRLATVRTDFFLNSRQRLTEQERALMTAMLHCLVGDIAGEIRARLPAGWTAANDEGNAALVDALIAARLLDHPRLMALLLRRADEERIATGARARTGRREARMLQGLVSHEEGAVAAAAMALILARGKRRDRFGQCLVGLDDLDGTTAEELVYAVAAALVREIGSDKAAGVADAALSEATRDLLDRRDPGRSIDALTATLVRILDEHGALDEGLVLAAANEGEVGLVAQALARAAGISGASALDELLSADPARLMLFLRAAGAQRALAAGLLAAIGDLLGLGDPGTAIDRFDRISDDEAAAARARLASTSAYRRALNALERSHGQRAL